MNRSRPKIVNPKRPQGLVLRAPKSALERWEPGLAAMKETAPEEAELSILGPIGPWEDWGDVSASMVQNSLKEIGRGTPLRLLLNSPGGDAFEGVAIYNLLAEHQGKVTTHVLGLAASAASVVAMAGDRIEMGEASTMMIHSAWGLVMGNSDELKAYAEFLDTIDGSVAELYANRSGKKLDDIVAMMKKETWMSAQQAVNEGFADVALKKDSKKAKALASTALASLRESIFARRTRGASLAAFGDLRPFSIRMSAKSPGASGRVVLLNDQEGRATMKVPIPQQIASFEAKRAANVARMEEIMSKAAEDGSTLEQAESEEYDQLETDVKTIDGHLTRLKRYETMMLSRATPVQSAEQQQLGRDAGSGSADPARLDAQARGRESGGVIHVRPNVEKGIAFTRYVKAIALSGRNNLPGALMIAKSNKQWHDQTPEVEQVLMAAVAGGDTTTAGWASELVYATNLVGEFIEFLRPKTIIGRIPGLTPVPFNVRVSGANAGSSGYWVGQGKPVPLSKMGTFAVTLGIAKAAGIVVLDQELIRSSQPSAELMVRNDLTKSVGQVCDVQFVDPGAGGTANVSPASVTSGVEPTAATGTDSAKLRADVQTLFGKWITQNLDPTGGVWIMTPMQALAISLMLNALGQPVFSGPANTINMNGGTFFGLPVVTSMSCQMVGSPVAGEGQMIILLNAPEIMLADDGAVAIEASSEASLEMLDNPTNTSTGGTTATSMVSMFQDNSVAIRAVRFMNWAKRRSIACQYIKDAAYVS